MTGVQAILPALATIPEGVFQGSTIASFQLGIDPVTNNQYRSHVDRFRKTPFVLLDTTVPGKTTLLRDTQPKRLLQQARSMLLGQFSTGYHPAMLPVVKLPKPFLVTPERRRLALAREGLEGEDLLKKVDDFLSDARTGVAALLNNWDSRNPLVLGPFVLFKLRSDLSPVDFDGPDQPVVAVSWYHAFEYCISNGLLLPTDDQWSLAAGLDAQPFYFPTATGDLWAPDHRKMGHFAERETCDVNDHRYPPAPNGIRHLVGEVHEWTAMNPADRWSYGLRGAAFDDNPDSGTFNFPHRRRLRNYPWNRAASFGFRVAE